MRHKIRVTLTDDHPVFLSGLRALIYAQAEVEFVGEATTGPSALNLIREKLPDVAVLDLSIPGINGIALIRRLAEDCPSVRILVLTVHEDRSYVNQALKAGACGYVLKRSAAANLVDAIRSVFVTGAYLDPAIDAGTTAEGKRPIPERDFSAELTARETEVLKLVALGYSAKEIAGRLDIGSKSVDTYKSRAAAKLGLKTRADIVRFASGQGWLSDV